MSKLAPEDRRKVRLLWRGRQGRRRYLWLFPILWGLVFIWILRMGWMSSQLMLLNMTVNLLFVLYCFRMGKQFHKELVDIWRTERLCLTCGYNLQGTTEAGRLECPECGAVVNPN